MWFLFILFERLLLLEYLSPYESDESDKYESDKLGSESGSAGSSGTGLDGLLRGVRLPLGGMISADESCDGD